MLWIMSAIFCDVGFAKKKPVLIYGGDKNYYPYSFFNDKGQPDGFSVDLIRAIGKEIGYSIDIRLGEWHAVKDSVISGKYDLIDIFNSPENQKYLKLAYAHAVITHEFVAHKNRLKIQRLEETFGQIIFVEEESTLLHYLQMSNQNYKIVKVSSEMEALERVNEGSGGLAIVSSNTIHEFVQHHPDHKLEPSGPLFFPAELSFAVPLSNAEFINVINDGLIKVKMNGAYSRIYKKWFGYNLVLTKWIKYQRMALIGLFVTAVLIILWVVSLRKIVRNRTKELLMELNRSDKISIELKEKERNLKEVQNIALVGSWNFTDYDGQLYMEFSENLMARVGFKEASIQMNLKDFQSYIHKDYRRDIDQNFNSSEDHSFTIRVSGNEGKEDCYLYFYVRPTISSSGKIIGKHGSFIDISGLKKAQIRLEEKNIKLNQINEELDKLVYSLSHDMRNPIASLNGLIHLMKIEFQDNQMKEYLERLRYCVVGLNEYANNMLAFSMNLNQDVSYCPIDFESLINESVSIYKYLKGANHITINKKIDLQSPFYSDPQHLMVIFNNIISNAIKYQDYRKDRSILEIQVKNCGQGIQVLFIDNGQGIERQYIGSIFNMFQRSNIHSDGAGLGLFIVKGAVAKLQGSVEVESKLGEGATFTVTLPSLVHELEEKNLTSVV